MESQLPTPITAHIKDKIHTIRDMQVMLDHDLAELYDVSAKRLNEQVKRNIERFPEDFMFQLTPEEFELLRSQNATSNKWALGGSIDSLKQGRGGRRYLPYAFTEQGVAALSGVLNSKTAIEVNIRIVRAFVAMRKFISKNAEIFQRLDMVEIKQIEHDKKFDEIFDAIQNKSIKPEKGIFFEGQIFDAYKFVSDIVRSAKKSIALVDNYVDDSVLTLINKRNKGVNATIFTKEITKQLALDLEKHNQQYPQVEIREFGLSHDRFLIIDNKELYHFGASLKDLGKKWFAFSKFDKETFYILGKLEPE